MKTKEHVFIGPAGYYGFQRNHTYLLRYKHSASSTIAIELDHLNPKQEPLHLQEQEFRDYFKAIDGD